MGYLKKHWQSFLLVAIMLASFILMIFSLRDDSLTNDEKIHIPAGYLHVWKGDYTFNTEHPPLLNDLAGLFVKIGSPNLSVKFQKVGYNDLFFYQSGNNVDEIVFWARLPFVLLTLGLIFIVFIWARALFGVKAGLVAATLTAFSPNILAHGRLATTDIGLVFFFLLSCWLLRKYVLKPSIINALWLGGSVGLTLLSKFSGILILIIIFISMIYLWFLRRPNQHRPINLLGQLLIILILPIVLLWGVYAFSMRSDIAKTTQTYSTSKILGSRQISSKSLKLLIIPLDKYIHGMEVLSDNNVKGRDAYLNGMIDRGWWYYFPYVLLYKLTIPVMVLMLLTIIFFKWTKKDLPAGGYDEFLLIFTPLLFFGISMMSYMNVGIRYILVILPFMFIFISRLMTVRFLVVQRIVLVLLVACIVIGILAFPNYLAYFNQFAGGAKGGIKHLSDSNLDWNQNVKRFAQYVKENNIGKVYGVCWDTTSFTYYGIDYETLPKLPVDGVVVICAQQSVLPPPKVDLTWVTKYPPDDIIGDGIYIWRFDQKSINRAGL